MALDADGYAVVEEAVDHPGLQQHRCDEDRRRAEELFGNEERGASIGALVALLAVPLDQLEHRSVEGGVNRAGGGDDRGEVRTGRAASPPQHHRTDGVGELVAHAEQELVGVVGGDTEFVGDLRWREPMAELQVEDARVAFTEDCDGGLYQRIAIVAGTDLRHVERAVRSDEVGRAAVMQAGHDVVVLARATPLALEAIERTVAGDTQQPTTERIDPLECVDAFPRDDERVLRDVGRRVGVAHDVAGHVVHAVEPPLEEHAERVTVAAAHGGHQGGIVTEITSRHGVNRRTGWVRRRTEMSSCTS